MLEDDSTSPGVGNLST